MKTETEEKQETQVIQANEQDAQEVTIIDEKPVEIQSDAPVTPMVLLKQAMDKGADLATLEKFMDLNDRWEAKEAAKAFNRAMTAFKANTPEILKNKRVSYQGNNSNTPTEYNHADLFEVCDKACVEMANHGLSHSWETQQDNGRIIVTCVITHELGHEKRVALESIADSSGSKNAIQSVASTITYLERYTMMAALGLAAKDQDDDGKGPKPPPEVEFISEDEAMTIGVEAKKRGIDMDVVLTACNITDLRQIPLNQYARVMDRIKKTPLKSTPEEANNENS